MNEEIVANSISDFKNRKTGLMLFGILQLIMGALSFLFFIFTIFTFFLSSAINQAAQSEINPIQLLFGSFFYLIIAIVFIWLGIGSMGAKRWARALTLILSWFWLIIGIIVLIFMIYLMNGGFENFLQGNQSADPAIFKVLMIVMIFIMSIFMVLLPIGFILFYKSKHVKKTVEHFDSNVRWTDKCPLPVLAASLIFGYTAIFSVFNGIYGWVVPFMGFIFSGWMGALILLLNSIMYAYLAFQFYYMDKKSWLIALGYNIFWAISILITFSTNSIWDLYEKMNMNEAQISQLKTFGFFDDILIYLMIIIFAGYIGYIIYLKHFFYLDSEIN